MVDGKPTPIAVQTTKQGFAYTLNRETGQPVWPIPERPVAASDLPALIQSIHRALSGISQGSDVQEAAPKEPAVPVRRSITPDHLVCLEDGRKFKSLKRHLRTKYNMSPEEYRAKWSLPKDYPMTAPNYSERRRVLAKEIGLGAKGSGGGRKPAARGRAKAK